MKKLLSVLLVCVLLVSAAVPAVSAAAAGTNRLPVIQVKGRGTTTPIYDAAGKRIFPLPTVQTDFITGAVKECLPLLAKGVFTGNYDEWAARVAEIMAPIYQDLIPEKDGVVRDGSSLKNVSGAGKPLYKGDNDYDYIFRYDWRQDIFMTAADLHETVQQVKAATGAEKVSISARCYGGNVLAAYLYEYGHEDVDTAVFYCSIADGCIKASESFGGKFALDPEALSAYLDSGDVMDDPAMTEMLRSTVAYLNSFYGLDLTADLLAKIVNALYKPLAPELLPVSYGAFTCFWSMVDDENYTYARNLVFGDKEEEYADFLQKIDHYHYDIQNGFENWLTRYQAEGLNVAVVVKYNTPIPPLFRDSDQQGDETVEVASASFGAVSAKYGETLDRKYLAAADPEYVSSDHIIDASTCLFPESTWFIKDLPHGDFPYCADELIRTICNAEGQMTVSDDPAYPRFLKYADNALSPLTDEPENEGSLLNFGFFKRFLRFMQAIADFFRNLFRR